MSYTNRIHALIALVATVATLYVQSAHAADSTSVSDSNDWLDNTLGMNAKNVPFFPDVVSNRTGVSIGDKSYDINNDFLPHQIRVDEASLLTAPIELHLDGAIVGEDNATNVTSIESNNLLLHTSHQLDLVKFQLDNQIKISPDGFIANTINITPNGPSTISSLKIVFKLDKNYANYLEQYFPYDYVKQRVIRKNNEYSNRAIDSDFTFPFTPIMWLGNPKAGVEILMEDNISYSLKNPRNANSIELKDGYVQLTHTIIDKPIQISKSLAYNIGILATPTRKNNKQARNFLLTSRANRISNESHFSEIHVGHWKRDGFPYPGIPQTAEKGSPERASFDKRIDKLEKQSVKHIPYSALHMMVSTLPELIAYRDEWPSGPANRGSIHLQAKIDHPRPSQPVTLDSRSIQDFVTHKHATFQREHASEGIYIDVAMPNQAEFTTDRKIAQTNNRLNKSAVFFPIFSHRGFLQRYWTALKKQSSDFTIVHHGNKLPHYVQSFIDVAVIGESIHTRFEVKGNMRRKKIDGKLAYSNPADYKPNYFALSPSEFPGIGALNSDTRQVIIPQIVKFNDNYLKDNPEKFAKWTRSFLAVALLNDMQIWNTRLDSNILKKLIKTLENFNEFANADFYKTQLPSDDVKIVTALYKGNKNSLLVLANYAKSSMDVDITETMLMLPRGSKFSVIDLETDDDPQPTGLDNQVELPSEDFKLLLITEKSP